MADNLESLVEKAGTAFSEGRYDEAKQLYERATLSSPSNAVLHCNLSAIYLRLGRAEDAVQAAETAARIDPHYARAHFRLGQSLRPSDPHRALLSLCRATRMDPKDRQTLIACQQTANQIYAGFPLSDLKRLGLDLDAFTLLATVGQLLAEDGEKLADAVQVLTSSLSLDSPSLKIRESTLASLGSSHFRLGDYRKAIAYYEQQLELCQELGGNENSVRDHIASAAETVEDWQLAELHRKKRIASKSLSKAELTKEFELLGEALLQLGRPDEAVCQFERVQTERGRVGRACAIAQMGDVTTALPLLLSLRPSCPLLSSRVVAAVHRCYLEEARLEDALEYLNDALEHATLTHNTHGFTCACGLLCETHLRMGNVSVAMKLAKRMLRLARGSGGREDQARALLLLAAAYEHNKDIPSAVALRKEQLNLLPRDSCQFITSSLQLASIMGQAGMDGHMPYVQMAYESAQRSENPRYKADGNSAMLRALLGAGRTAEALTVLESQKDLLECQLDSATRSLIYEDISLAGADEGTSKDNGLEALEHSLTEAQDANDARREQHLLIEMGDRLLNRGERRQAEEFYSRSLALAKQLRLAVGMQRAHSKLARLYKDSGDWDQCADHGRSCLTISKILGQPAMRIEMMLLVGEAEMNRGQLDLARAFFERSLRLSLTHDVTDDQARSHGMMGRLLAIQGHTQKAISQLYRHISLGGPPSALCRSLLLLASLEHSSADSLSHLKRCADVAAEMDTQQQRTILFRCFDAASSLGHLDYCIDCLQRAIIIHRIQSIHEDSAAKEGLLSRFFSLPLRRQVILLLLIHEICPDLQEINDNLAIVCPDLMLPKSSTWQLLEAFRNQRWDDVLTLLPSLSSSAFELCSGSLLRVRALFETTSLSEAAAAAFNVGALLSLHDISWQDPFWESCSSHEISFRVCLMGGASLIGEEVTSLDKILSAAITGEAIELIPMWYNETVDWFLLESWPLYTVFPLSTPCQRLRLAAAVLALQETDSNRQINIIESCKHTIYSRLLAEHGGLLSASSQVHLKENETYIFEVASVQLIWLWQQGDKGPKIPGHPNLYYRLTSSNRSFYAECLLRILRRSDVIEISSIPTIDTVICDTEVDIQCEHVKMWLREEKDDICSPFIGTLCLSDISLNGAVSAQGEPLSLILRKWADCQISVLDSSQVPAESLLLSSKGSPRVVIIRGSAPISKIRAILLSGTATVVQVEESSSSQHIQEMIDILESSLPASSLPYPRILYGSPDYRLPSQGGLPRIRQMAVEDGASFLLLCRASQEGAGLLADIARGIADISLESSVELLSLLRSCTSTKTVNEIFNLLESGGLQDIPPECSLLRRAGGLTFFMTLYKDHIFTYNPDATARKSTGSPTRIPKTPTTPRRLKHGGDSDSMADSSSNGYASDGEYLVPPRRSFGNLPNGLRSSATVLSVQRPEF